MYAPQRDSKEQNLKQYLSHLDCYLKAKPVTGDSFTSRFFLEFRARLDLSPQTVNGVMSKIHGFFQYLQRTGHIDHNPLLGIPPLRERRFIPFVFSPAQIELLLMAVQNRVRKNERYFLRDLAEYIGMVLLARCGLRITEPTRLLIHHFRQKEATMYIEKTKFRKDRLIPLPQAVVKEIENYLSVRRTLMGEDPNPYLLICGKQRRLTQSHLYKTFTRAVKDMGLDQAKKIYADTVFGRPTPHSLRHSFAINTLGRIKEQGKSPQNALPVLAAYMGHRQYQNTAVYLKVIDARQRLELLNVTRSRWQV